jgi:tRNA C32,U32 (ribose-2'-O)-methylase TrmJ
VKAACERKCKFMLESLLNFGFVCTGEMHAQHKEIKEASMEAVRAREELTRAGACDDFAQRLAALEAAISTTSQALQSQQRALAEMESASRSVEQAQARLCPAYIREQDFCACNVHGATYC